MVDRAKALAGVGGDILVYAVLGDGLLSVVAAIEALASDVAACAGTVLRHGKRLRANLLRQRASGPRRLRL